MRDSMRLVKEIGIGAIAWLIAATPSDAACEFFSSPQRYNTQTNGDVIVIGAQLDRPYHVIVTGDNETTLAGIRSCILDAFISQSHLGPYIQVGSFDRRSDAETIKRILRQEGYRARVIYQG
jgi:hypothetical protein